MKYIFALSLIFASLLSLPSFAADPIAVCPEEKDESASMSWDLAAVMRTYRDSLNNSEEIILGALRGNEDSRLKIPEAISWVQKALDCSAYVFRHHAGSMVAKSISEETLEEQPKYLALYKEMSEKTMELFKSLRDGLKAEFAKPVSEQNYQASSDLIRAIHDYENKAHRKF